MKHRDDLDSVAVHTVHDSVVKDTLHEAPSRPPYTGDLVGRDAVRAMMAKAGELTVGTLRLDLDDVLANDRHTVALVVWSAERGERTLREREVAVHRVRDGQLAQAWFSPDDPCAVDEFWA